MGPGLDGHGRAEASTLVGRRVAPLLVALVLAITGCTAGGPSGSPLGSPVPGTPPIPTPQPPSRSTPASTPTPTPSATTTPAQTTEQVVFGDPWSSDYHRVHAVVESAIALVDASTKGQTILLTVFNLTYPPVTRALVRAHKRGVRVRVVVNATAARKAQVRELRAELGTRTSAASWLVVRRGGFRMHSKFLLISGEGKPPVVWVSSGNLTNADGHKQANAALTTTGDEALLSFFAKQFDLMSRSVTDPRLLGRTAITATSTAYTFPVPKGGPAHDPVEALLDNVTCKHGDRRTSVRLAQLLFKTERIYLVTRLRQLRAEGCAVTFLGHTKGYQRPVRRALTRPGPGRIDLREMSGFMLHTKITSVDGWDASGQRIKVALVGTHNLSGRALVNTPRKGVNDELAMRITNPEVVDAYNAWIEQVRRLHSYPVR